jgi:hypothetical protein
MELPVEQELQALQHRVDTLERVVSSVPPAQDLHARGSAPPPSAARRGLHAWLDEKVVLTGMISLVGVWATIYTNDKRLEQDEQSKNQELELETVKYQVRPAGSRMRRSSALRRSVSAQHRRSRIRLTWARSSRRNAHLWSPNAIVRVPCGRRGTKNTRRRTTSAQRSST